MPFLGRITSLFPILLLASCTIQPPTPAFTGPVAHLMISEIARGPFAANVTYVAKINGQDFQGQMHPSQPPPDTPLAPHTGIFGTITIPAGPGTYTVVGDSIFQAPIFALAMDKYCIAGDISFTPAANANYILEGTFTPAYTALWIEDAATNQVEGNKIEIHGSALMSSWAWKPPFPECWE